MRTCLVIGLSLLVAGLSFSGYCYLQVTFDEHCRAVIDTRAIEVASPVPADSDLARTGWSARWRGLSDRFAGHCPPPWKGEHFFQLLARLRARVVAGDAAELDAAGPALAWFETAFAATPEAFADLRRSACLVHVQVTIYAESLALAFLEAARRAARGDYDGARRLWEALLVFGHVRMRGLCNEQRLAMLAQGALVCRHVYREMAHVLCTHEVPPAAAARMLARAALFAPLTPPLRTALEGERAFMRRLDRLARDQLGFFYYHVHTPAYGLPAATYEPFFDDLLGACRGAPWATMRGLEVATAKWYSSTTARKAPLHPLPWLAGIEPRRYYSRVLDSQMLLEALPALARLGEALRASGARAPTPAMVSGLALPDDLFTGRPLRLETRADGFALMAGPWTSERTPSPADFRSLFEEPYLPKAE